MDYQEGIFKKVTNAGSLAIILGIISIVVGIGVGVLSIINGAKLLTGRLEILD